MGKKRDSNDKLSNIVYMAIIFVLLLLLVLNFFITDKFQNIQKAEEIETKKKNRVKKKVPKKDEPVLPSKLRWEEDFIYKK